MTSPSSSDTPFDRLNALAAKTLHKLQAPQIQAEIRELQNSGQTLQGQFQADLKQIRENFHAEMQSDWEKLSQKLKGDREAFLTEFRAGVGDKTSLINTLTEQTTEVNASPTDWENGPYAPRHP
jgi:DNA anti-recombination protein RmuC